MVNAMGAAFERSEARKETRIAVLQQCLDIVKTNTRDDAIAAIEQLLSIAPKPRNDRGAFHAPFTAPADKQA